MGLISNIFKSCHKISDIGGWWFPGMVLPPPAPGILAQNLRQEFLREICARNSCAKFAPGILAQILRQES